MLSVRFFSTQWSVTRQAPLVVLSRYINYLDCALWWFSSIYIYFITVRSILLDFNQESFEQFQNVKLNYFYPSVQFSSVTQSCPTLCDPMNSSTPGLPVHHHLTEFIQTQVHQVGDAIQPSHPLSSPFLPAPNPSQHQRLFWWVNSSHEVVKYWSFSFSIIPSKEIPGLICFRMDCWISLQSKGLSRVFSNTTGQKHQFFGAQPSSQSNSHIYTWPLEKP